MRIDQDSMPTCKSILHQYFQEHVAVKVVARRRFEECQRALNSFFADTPIQHVDIPLCREYGDHREGITDSTVRRELGVLQAAANHALKWRRIKPDGLPSIELPPEGTPRRIWLFKEELAHLLQIAETNDRRVFHFLQLTYHTASRKSAIENLQWSQVDIPALRINLQAPGAPVTKKRRPIVPISEAMAEELSIMKTKAINQWVLADNRDIRPAFDRISTIANLQHLQGKGLREAGQLTPHILRHSRATHLLQANKSPWTVANLLGDSLTTVLRVYGHACPDYLEEALA